jgi:hypothetical protein
MGNLENPLPASEGTNFSSRFMGAVYWMLWSVVLASMIGASVGAIVWVVLVYGEW